MKKYLRITIECFDYRNMIEIYENEYRQDYQLIGYEHDAINQVGVLVLCERGK